MGIPERTEEESRVTMSELLDAYVQRKVESAVLSSQQKETEMAERLARTMICLGYSMDQIIRYTELSAHRIAELADQINQAS